jgi:hypothetical protein
MLYSYRFAIIALALFSIFIPASSLLGVKPQVENFRQLARISMTDARSATSLIVPIEAPAVRQHRKAIISAVLTVSYMSIIVSVMALPVCLSAISADLAFYGAKTKKSFLSEVVFTATIAIVSYSTAMHSTSSTLL